jgi:hypothetical protein
MSGPSSTHSIPGVLARGAVLLFAIFLLLAALLGIFGALTPLSAADPIERNPVATALLFVYAGVLLAPRLGNSLKRVALFKQVIAWSGVLWCGVLSVQYLIDLAGGRKTPLGLPFIGGIMSAAVLGALLVHFASRRLET